MRKLVATEYVSLDGVFEEPGQWSFPFWSDAAAQFKLEELMASDAQLLGRKTYEGFAAAWPTMTDEAGFSERMNGMPKHVVSRTLERADWHNSHVIRGNVVEAVATLKAQPGQDILLAGSGQLLDTLLRAGLVDELRLMLHPLVLGRGQRLFRDGTDATTFTLTGTRPLANGVIVLTYQPAPPAAQ
jgi:dihydrofolate reductase